MQEEKQHLSNVRAWFDHRVQRWHNAYVGGGQMFNVVLSERKAIGVEYVAKYTPAGGRVLDAGCGAGLAALDLVRRGYFVHGIDISEQMIAKARHTFAGEGIAADRYEFTASDIGQAGLAAGSFDAILALGFLQYQKDEHKALRQFHQLLKPGGVLVISGPVRNCLANGFGLRNARFYNALMSRLYPSDGKSEAEALLKISINGYSLRRFKQLLAAAGFRPLEFLGHGFTNFMIIGRWLNFRREYFLHRTLTRLARVAPVDRFANDLVVVARSQERT